MSGNMSDSCSGSELVICDFDETDTKTNLMDEDEYFPNSYTPADESLLKQELIISDTEIKQEESNDDDDDLVCSECWKSFDDTCTLDEHMKTHAGMTTFNCETCCKAFGNQDSLNIHKRIHGPVDFYCFPCERYFTSSQELNTHEETIHFQIRKAERVTTSKKTFVCTICPRSKFAKFKTFRKHMSMKHDIAAYRCLNCLVEILTVEAWEQHVKSHSALINLQCRICNMGFTNDKGLRQHYLRRHWKKFQCPVCKSMFKRMANVRRHLKLVHKEVPIAQHHLIRFKKVS